MNQTTEKLTECKHWVAEMYFIGVFAFAAKDNCLTKEGQKQLKMEHDAMLQDSNGDCKIEVYCLC